MRQDNRIATANTVRTLGRIP